VQDVAPGDVEAYKIASGTYKALAEIIYPEQSALARASLDSQTKIMLQLMEKDIAEASRAAALRPIAAPQIRH